MSSDSDTQVGIAVGPVGRWLAERVERAAPPFAYARILGGHSNLTYLVTDRDGRRYVLRRPPVGPLLATAHNVIREHDVMRAVAGSGLPVPRMLGVCADEKVTGAPFYVMEYVDGVVVDSAADAAEFLPSAQARQRAGEELIDALVTLHGIDVDRAGLGELSRRGGYLGRQLRRWSEQWAAAGLDELADMTVLHGWLVEHQPAETTPCLVHGDFRLGNALIERDGRLLAVLDWELCTLGEGLLDLAYFLRSWMVPDLRPGFSHPPGLLPGFADGEDLIRRYAERSGRSVADLDYWRAFTAWRSAAILAGVYRRYLDGQLGERPENLESFRAEVVSRIQQGIDIARAIG
ncbi:phosphotransferase family protein [Nocardia macrotermitis]|uniref:Putative aminoglycoside phosphotransferase n=1 Tax=Nocardia macrotermitis TaxID=2585198 RepID=A0A7K0DED9_9NOCA|nr:phosphotransferase family protein [Nocardia macrotermitis]MQY24160.1 putative aminoglycoside phosphotransferase [Nocardia macrotermitis]